ncbi:hypothetical protein OK016_29830 [Vibrio chagasii]|nr:hypothetical protein [Vibrio chagasii]
MAFTGSTGSRPPYFEMCLAESLIPSTVELGGKSPNSIYFPDIFDYEDEYLNKCVEACCWRSLTKVRCVPVHRVC